MALKTGLVSSFRRSGNALLERYHPTSRNCEVKHVVRATHFEVLCPQVPFVFGLDRQRAERIVHKRQSQTQGLQHGRNSLFITPREV